MESWRISFAHTVEEPPQSMWACHNPTCLYKWPRASTGPSILLIDGNDIDRTYFATELKRRALDYDILEAFDGRLFNSRRMDCVVLALDLPDQSGFQLLIDLVPLARRPNVAVVVLTHRLQRGLRELAMKNGAQTCCVKQFTSGDELYTTIQRAIAHLGTVTKEDRHSPGGAWHRPL